jgi:hypothetical protein
MLNRKDSAVVLLATSRQWRDPDKFQSVESHVFIGSLCGASGAAAKLGQRISGREVELLQ